MAHLEDLRHALRLNRSEVTLRGHSWDVADVIAVVEGWLAVDTVDAYPAEHFHRQINHYTR